MPKNKYYVVWKGHEPGIFDNWADCKKMIDGFTGALYKSFETRKAALKAMDESPWDHVGQKKPSGDTLVIGKPLTPSLSVDAACSGNPGTMEYQGVDTATGKLLFYAGPFDNSTVNIGEFLAIVHGLSYLKKKGSNIPVYSDSRTALKWVKDKAVKTTLQPGPENAKSFQWIERAIAWLENNSWENRLLKWETRAWGEIPADFGRK